MSTPDRAAPPVLDRTAWWLVAVNVLAVAGLLLYAVVSADMLPERYPVHFNGAGRPDRWAHAGSGEWFLVPGLGALMMLAMAGLALALPRIPLHRWNLPSKGRLLRLDRARQVPVIRSTVVFLLVLALLHSLLLLGIQRSMFSAVLSGEIGGAFLPGMITFGVLYCGYIVWWIVHVRRLIARATRGE